MLVCSAGTHDAKQAAISTLINLTLGSADHEVSSAPHPETLQKLNH